MHRLISCGRQVNYSKTHMPETNAGVGIKPHAITVWTAMFEGAQHARRSRFITRRLADKSNYSAHALISKRL